MQTEDSPSHSRPKVALLLALLLMGAAGVGGIISWPLLLPSAMYEFGWSATRGAVMLLIMGLVAAVSGTFLSIVVRPGGIPLVSFAASGLILGGGFLASLSQTLIPITIGLALVGGGTGAFLACVGLIFSGGTKDSSSRTLILAATTGLGLSLLLVAIFVPLLRDMTGWSLSMMSSGITAALAGVAAGSIGLSKRGLLRDLSSKDVPTQPTGWSDQWSMVTVLVIALLAVVWGMVVFGQLAAPPLVFSQEYGNSSLRVGVLFAVVGLGIGTGGIIGWAMRSIAPRLLLLPVFAMLGVLSVVLSTAETGSVDYFVVMSLLSVNAGTALFVLMVAGSEYSFRGHLANTFTLSLCVALVGIIFLVYANDFDSFGTDSDLSDTVQKIGTWGLVLFLLLGGVYTSLPFVLPFISKLNQQLK